MSKRAIRRHHRNRIFRKRRNHYGGWMQNDARGRKIINTARLCSCIMCSGNRGLPTRQDRQAKLSEREQLQEVIDTTVQEVYEDRRRVRVRGPISIEELGPPSPEELDPTIEQLARQSLKYKLGDILEKAMDLAASINADSSCIPVDGPWSFWDYPISLTRVAEDDGGFYYGAWLEDFGHLACSAPGDTPEEAIKLLEKVYLEVVDFYREVGKPIPPPSSTHDE